MKVLIFDTETTGLPNDYKKQAISEPNNWPHIVSISWAVLDTDTNKVISQKSFTIKPENWTISPEVSKIHGITHNFAMKTGVLLLEAMSSFASEKYDLLVAHNIDFDYNVIMNAYYWDLKNEVAHMFAMCSRRCTMKLSTELCKLPGKYGYRWPKLSELYEFTFQRKPVSDSLHSSIYDTLILTEIIQHCDELRYRMGLPVKLTFVSNGPRNKTLLL